MTIAGAQGSGYHHKVWIFEEKQLDRDQEAEYMSNKEFVLNRICIFAGKTIDPCSDEQVTDVLRSQFDIRLPQRRSLEESLVSAKSDHDIIELILKYRAMT